MEDLESVNSANVKQEPNEELYEYSQSFRCYNKPLETLKSVNVKLELRQSPLEHNMNYSVPLEFLTSVSVKQESNECDLGQHKLLDSETSISLNHETEQNSENVKQELKADSNKNMCFRYNLFLETVKSENVKQSEDLLEYKGSHSTDNFEIARPESVRETWVCPLGKNMYENNSEQFTALKQHLNIHRQITEINESEAYDYQKERLKQSIARKSSIEQHTNTSNIQKAYEYKLSDNKTVNAHKRRCGKPPSEKRYKCGICDYKAAHLSKLETHRITHTGEKPHKCNLCDYKSGRLSSLKQHIIMHTGEKPYKCDICDFRTAQASDLKRHLKRHTGEKPHKCNLCDFKSGRLSSLKQHIILHTGEKPYKCDICDYRTAHASDLKRHIKRHTGEKPHKCDICEFRTIRITTLKKHIKLHSGEKPY